MDLQGASKMRYKLYTMHKNNSEVPPRTRSRLAKRRRVHKYVFYLLTKKFQILPNEIQWTKLIVFNNDVSAPHLWKTMTVNKK